MSKEYFCDSICVMSFEEIERLVEKSSFFVSINSLGEKCEKAECSKEKENDLQKNERTKEISEEKGENLKEDLNTLGLYVDNTFELSLGFPSPCELKVSWNFKENFDWMRRSFAFTCQVLLEIVHIIPPLVNTISNFARLLWLFEGTNSRTNLFKGEADGMTQDKHENMGSFKGSVTSFQGPVIRSRARKIEEETQRNKFGRV
ncbi:hypothetical protein M9H77_22563 [Catharanthus roseus]|uniref:Uncharacterized protein n=1 Tax=Catharanthus roseus TaxID=4058 RepID=A0ACC0ASB3_CATRO|nr:hypothetical protein M9H77_22563 [Catharanthus roseus]